MEEPTATIATSELTPGVQYHLHAECTGISATSWVGGGIDIGDFTVPAPAAVGAIDVEFSVGESTSGILLHAPTGPNDFCIWNHVMLCTRADWQALRARGVTWFDGDSQSPQPNAGLAFPLNFGQTGNTGNTGMIVNNGSYASMPVITAHGGLNGGLTLHWNTSDGNEGDLSYKGSIQNVPVTINTDTHSAIMGGLDVSYQLGSRDWPRIPAGGSCSFALLASGGGWVTIQSHDTYM